MEGISNQPSYDVSLLARIAHRDVAAFEEIYARYSRSVYSLALRLLGDRQVAQEVAQEIFLSIWRGASGFDPDRGSARSWVLSLSHHKTVDALRRMRRCETAPLATAATNLSPVNPITDETIRSLESETIRQALLALSSEQREAIVLAYYGGFTQQEIAARLEIPLGTVKTRTRDGILRLRMLLGSEAEETPR